MNTEFYKLSINKQVNFINNELQKDKNISVTKLCKKFGLNKSTIISRFTKDGYKYNVDTRKYIKDNEVIQNSTKNINKEIIENHNKNISINEIPKNNNLIDMHDLKSTLEEVKEILALKEQLKEIIQHYNKSKNIIDIPEPTQLRIDKDKFDGELKGRLIKVYENINNDWVEFCKKNSEFKMQDLYSMALLEFINKYNKKEN